MSKWNDADRQAFSDRAHIKASTVQPKRPAGPVPSEWEEPMDEFPEDYAVPDVMVTGEHWRCSCGRTSLHITQTIPTVRCSMQCRHCGEHAEWVPMVPLPPEAA